MYDRVAPMIMQAIACVRDHRFHTIYEPNRAMDKHVIHLILCASASLR